jgi:lipoprotein-anchoring transpeptidase ErfK/SrfK
MTGAARRTEAGRGLQEFHELRFGHADRDDRPCPVVVSSAPLAMVDPYRPMTTIFDQVMRDQSSDDLQDEITLPAELRRQTIAYATPEAPGTIVIDTPHTYLYYVPDARRTVSQQTLPLPRASDRRTHDSLVSAFSLY